LFFFGAFAGAFFAFFAAGGFDAGPELRFTRGAAGGASS